MLRFGGRQKPFSVRAAGLVIRLFWFYLLRKKVCLVDQNKELRKSWEGNSGLGSGPVVMHNENV